MKKIDQLMAFWVRKCEKVHHSKTNRIKWRNFCFFVYFCLFWFFFLAGLFFTFGGLTYNSNSDVQYKPFDWYNHMNRTFMIIGLVTFTVATIIGLFLSVVLPKIYKDSKSNYLTTKDFKQKREKWMNTNLVTYSKKDLKWLKKLNFIDQIKYEQTLNLKLKQQKNHK